MSLASRSGALALAVLLAPPMALAHDHTHGSLRIVHPWARETPAAARTGGAYMKIENSGDAADRLLRAASPRAGRVEIHIVIMDGDVMRMREVPAIELVPKSTVELKPGGYHIMLMDLKAPLKAGERFPLALTFEKAGAVTVEVLVEKMSGPRPDHDKMKH